MPNSPPATAPEVWVRAQAAAARVLRPLERFLHVEATSGVLLLAAAACALAWANSAWADSYEHLWHMELAVAVGPYAFTRSLHFWINEGLMTIFFFVVGLEIRREIYEGELSDLRKAALPIAAAFGGMAAPALLYLALNREPLSRAGWGVPMATDIAFAVGVLALLGRRVPAALRVLLLALAIIDDIGAILVIAFFYSGGVTGAGLVVAAFGVLAVLLLQRLGVRRSAAYVLPGVIIWAGLLHAGVHPTIAGVALGLLTPAQAWFGKHGFVSAAQAAIDQFSDRIEGSEPTPQEFMQPLRRIQQAQREALAPAVRLQALLHPWVAFAIMPLFAFANAGVSLAGIDVEEPGVMPVLGGIIIGLVVGKPLGIVGVSLLAVKLRLCALPRGVRWSGVLLVGCVSGIGFTMAIFIAGLAFSQPHLLAAAKLGVLLASIAAGALGCLIGLVAMRPSHIQGAALTASEAEASLHR